VREGEGERERAEGEDEEDLEGEDGEEEPGARVGMMDGLEDGVERVVAL
jgi:hypothetical protein